MASRAFAELPRQDRRLTRRFYSTGVIALAQALLGRTLIHDSEDGLTGGRIVETEAYLGAEDPGSHAYRRMTERNRVMFGEPGHLYVYFTYGMHFCVNIVGEAEGTAGAVLIRAIEPTIGVDLMGHRRGTDQLNLIARGPARLAQAMGFAREHNGLDLVTGPAWVQRRRVMKGAIGTSPRIGLHPGIDQPWRFFEVGPWVSRTIKTVRRRSRPQNLLGPHFQPPATGP